MSDAAILASITTASVVLGIWAALGWRISAREIRRIRGYSDYWREQAMAYAIELDRILEQRSETTRKGNLTRAAQRRALRDATTQQLRGEKAA